ncbi:MAG: insulinase family protein [Bacteroidales bacterium]|nr:MAG: insulinase family protein [Bacteroidales bacterium]
MRRIYSTMLILLSFAFGINAQPQQIDWNSPVPVDPNVRIGKLDNGLTYYIRKNTEPKQRADFYIAQNVGAILEEDNQNGLAHFLEHMAFNGTKNFPGKKLLNYFESIGVKFGQNINAYTSLDQTVYNLADVPTTREGIVDSALLVLHDWSNFISLESTEIDNERGVIREEWRTGRGPEARMRKELMPIMYKDSKYAKRDVIGDINVINNFDHKVIRDFYNQWYRPDLQSIVIVGDIDVNVIEQKVKQLFADIKKRENSTPRPYYELPDNVEPLIGVASDPEARNSMVTIFIKQPTNINEPKNLGYLRTSIKRTLISNMISARFNELVQKPNPPFVFAGVGIGSIVRTKDVVYLYSAANGDKINEGVKGLLREAQRIKQFGFAATELERMKADYLRGLENSLKEKDKEKNEKFVNEYVNNFLENLPIPGIQFNFMFASGILPSISIDEINTYAKSLINDQNMVVSVNCPKKDNFKIPTVDEISKAIQEVKVEKIEAYIDKVSNKPLVEKVPAIGKTTSTKEDKVFGTIEWTLSNGVKVVFKKTDFKADEIQLNVFSPGGISLVDTKTVPSASMASQLVANGGIGEFTSTDLEKMLAGKVVQVQPIIGESFEGFQGSSSPKDFETMLQLVYLYFTQPREDEIASNTFMDRMKAFFANNASDPRMAFRDSITVLMANRNPRVLPMNLDFLSKVDYKLGFEFYKNRFADASDFTFVLTGNINADEVKALVETYIGGLPSIKRVEVAKDNGVRPPKGKVQNHFKKTLKDPKASISISYTGDVDYSLENKVLIDVIKSVLNTRYIEEIREKEGATYGVGVRFSVRKFPIPSCTANFTFDTDPARKEKMIEIIHNEVKSLMTAGPSEVNLGKAKEFMLKSYDQNQRENGYWSNAIREKYENGIDINSTYKELVNGLTPEKVKALADKIFSQGNIVEVVMSPKE